MALFRRTPSLENLATRLPEGPLKTFAEHPAPPSSTPADQLRLLAVDVETTGLDPATDRLLSIGFVPVDGSSITLRGAGQYVIRSTTEVGQSATIHGITDDDLAAGVPLADALAGLLEALAGRVLLAHHAVIERDFLTRAMQQVWGQAVPLVCVDTMQLQYRLLTQGFDDEPPQGSLRLWNARQQYGLPRYQAHEALTDALACGELYLAQMGEIGWQTPLKKLS